MNVTRIILNIFITRVESRGLTRNKTRANTPKVIPKDLTRMKPRARFHLSDLIDVIEIIVFSFDLAGSINKLFLGAQKLLRHFNKCPQVRHNALLER